MSQIGYVFEFEKDETKQTVLAKVLAPMPDRLAAACDANNVAILMTTDSMGEHNAISEVGYAHTVNNDKHPVSVHNLGFYNHDINLDHIPAVIVCGTALFDIIKSSQPVRSGLAARYDTVTSNVSSAIQSLLAGDFDEYLKRLRIASSTADGKSYDEEGEIFKGERLGSRIHHAIVDGLERLGISVTIDTLPKFEEPNPRTPHVAAMSYVTGYYNGRPDNPRVPWILKSSRSPASTSIIQQFIESNSSQI